MYLVYLCIRISVLVVCDCLFHIYIYIQYVYIYTVCIYVYIYIYIIFIIYIYIYTLFLCTTHVISRSSAGDQGHRRHQADWWGSAVDGEFFTTKVSLVNRRLMGQIFAFWRNIWTWPIYSGFAHWKWWFSIVMLVYQRVNIVMILS